MKIILFFTILTLSYIVSANSKYKLSKEIYKTVPFSSEFMEDGALIRNVHYPSVKKLASQIEKNLTNNQKLTVRGEAHITTITPPEAQGWFSDHKGINFFISFEELHLKYFKIIQKTNFKVICIGKVEDKGNTAYFLVLDSPALFKVRTEIETELKKRALFTGKEVNFEASSFYPHITIGYIGADVHTKPKDKSSCLSSSELIFF